MPLHVGPVPAEAVYLGGVPAEAVYLGGVQVWPTSAPPVFHEELFDTAMDGWTNFDVYGSIPYIHTTEQGRAGIDRYVAALGQQAYGCYVFTANTDNMFVEVTLADPCFGTISKPSAVDEFNYIYMRANNEARAGTSARFTFANNGKIEVGVDTAGSYVKHVGANIDDLEVGDTLRFTSETNGVHRAVNLTTGATLVEWVDGQSFLEYGNPDYRYAHMMQSTHTTLGVQYSSFAIDRWAYGDMQ